MKKIFLVIFYTLLLSACQPQALDTQELIFEPSYDASLSSQGDLALVSTANNGLQLWDLHKQTQLFTWRHGEAGASVFDTAISENQAYAASLSRDSVGLWRISDGHSLGWWSLPSSGQSVDVANNGALLIGLNDGSVMSLRPNSRTLIKFLGHSEKVNSVSLSSDGGLALTGSNDKHAILWNPSSGQPIQDWQLDNRVIKVKLNASGNYAFIGDSTKVAQIMDNATGEVISQLNIHRRKMNFSAARFSSDDRQLITGTPARELIVWQVKTGEKLAKWQVQRTKHAQIKGAVVYSVANKDPDRIISISSNGLVETWPVPVH
ncbi:WD40 repeat domain-containing protein [Shewanella woodyi]|uniref:WD-40 repeat protein n=1 Tax=Shewanella woodyi (strain ATCC 51908 / MS32) TaxID=392500 RepID=B1KFU4_SHEWM|nr:lipoprotein [Shewanella woodyi]ACA85260.1 WD-40 repeat protein [Shewanella woodyi ATCC 51908]